MHNLLLKSWLVRLFEKSGVHIQCSLSMIATVVMYSEVLLVLLSDSHRFRISEQTNKSNIRWVLGKPRLRGQMFDQPLQNQWLIES